MEIQVIRHKTIFISIAVLLVVASVFAIAFYGLKLNIDFTGGTLWQIRFEEPVEQGELREFFHTDLNAPEAVVTQDSGQTDIFNIRLKTLSESLHQEYKASLQEEFSQFEELNFQAIGGTVGKELIKNAVWAIIINLLAIVLYVAYAFRRVSGPISSWKYSAVTLITLFHDAIIPIGVFALLGEFMDVRIDTNFVVATLVVMGFSVHDTIVVFDRIREKLKSAGSKLNFSDSVNESVNETMARSINTSLTLIIVLLALFILGAATLNYFILVILIGTLLGAYSSIFVASPLLALWAKRG